MKQNILSVELVSEFHGICTYEFTYMEMKFSAETKHINGKLDVLVSDKCPKQLEEFIKAWLREEI